jgi:hypothetical protein
VRGRLPFVYLTSPPFSGSTLFSFLANAHPAIATVGEMSGPVRSQDPDAYLCSCGQPIRRCLFWRQVGDRMACKGFEFDPGAFETKLQLASDQLADRLLVGSLRYSTLESLRDGIVKILPMHGRRLRGLVARIEALAASILEVTGKSVFFDASKNPMLIRQLTQSHKVDLRVVHLVRDVRGASLSMRVNKGETNWRRALTSWVHTNSAIERHLRCLPDDRWMRIRYEDMCRTPEETLNRLYSFCGVEPFKLPSEIGNVVHHIVGNRMRLSGIGQVRLHEEWRSRLSAEELNLADEIAGKMHVHYGYPRMQISDLEN